MDLLVFLKIIFDIAITRLDFSDGILDLAFFFKALVTDDYSGNVPNLTFHFFDSAFDLVFVHDNLLIIDVDN